MSKPVIGVMPLWDDEKKSLWMLPGYFNGILKAGGIPVMLPLISGEKELGQLMDMCDGFLLTGGHDVSPYIYDAEPLGALTVSCPVRDEMETVILKEAVRTDKPVLGICRGIQFINAALGGTLYQDLPTEHKSDVEHHQNAPYDVPAHDVEIIPGTPLHELLGADRLQVNSYHHQAVKDLAPCLVTMAESPDGLTEALYKPDNRFIWAVQWHPEFSYLKDENSRKIFEAFVGAMRG